MKSIRQALVEGSVPEKKESVPTEVTKVNKSSTLPSTKKELLKMPEKNNTLVNCIRTMLTDSEDDNSISSKRVVSLLAFIFCSIAFFANLFFNFEIAEFMYESMIWIVVGGLGFTALEKFAPKSKDD